MINEKREKQILFLSFASGLAFAIVELIYSIYSHSQSVLMDAVYDSSELIFIGLILFLTPLFYKPVTEKHPYGFYQVESIFLIIKGFMMLSVTVSGSMEIIETALSGGGEVNELQIAIFQFVLGLISVAIYFVMKEMNKSVSSPTADAEILGWKIDIMYSMGMSFAFFGSTFLSKSRFAFLSPYFDQIMAVLVIAFMLPENIAMLWGAIKDVFLFPPDEDTVNQIKEVCTSIMEKSDFEPNFFDVTRTGRHLWVSVYFDYEGEYLSIIDFDDVSAHIQAQLDELFDNCTCELILDTQ